MTSLPYAEALFKFLSKRETSTKNHEYMRRFARLVPFVQFKKREQHPWRIVTFRPAILLKVTLLHRCFSHFLNCTNGVRSRKASHISEVGTQERTFYKCILLNSIIDFILLVNHLSGRPLHTLAVNRRTELHYNLGLSLLHSGQAAKAFDCFIESRSSFQYNPRYWLRLAECCIALDKQVRQCFC